MDKYKKINIYLRQASYPTNKMGRPEWFCPEKAFVNLLQTTNFNICKLNVVFDGDISNHFTLKYLKEYNFNIIQIDTKSFNGPTYQTDGSCKSGALTGITIKNDNLPSDEVIYILENDYLHLPFWSEIALDFFNSVQNSNKYIISLYEHLDTFLFVKNASDHWGMYKDLKSRIFLSRFWHWRELPCICSSWMMSKEVFDLMEDCLCIGMSDNTMSEKVRQRGGFCASPIPTIATHIQEPFLAPFIDWEQLNNSIKTK